MTIFAIEAVWQGYSIALLHQEKMYSFIYRDRSATNTLLVEIQKLYDQAAISFSNTKQVRIINGPGSYTGLRISIATILGLCYTNTEIEIYTIQTVQFLKSCLTKSDDIEIYEQARNNEYYSIENHIIEKDEILKNVKKPVYFHNKENKIETNNVYINEPIQIEYMQYHAVDLISIDLKDLTKIKINQLEANYIRKLQFLEK